MSFRIYSRDNLSNSRGKSISLTNLPTKSPKITKSSKKNDSNEISKSTCNINRKDKKQSSTGSTAHRDLFNLFRLPKSSVSTQLENIQEISNNKDLLSNKKDNRLDELYHMSTAKKPKILNIERDTNKSNGNIKIDSKNEPMTQRKEYSTNNKDEIIVKLRENLHEKDTLVSKLKNENTALSGLLKEKSKEIEKLKSDIMKINDLKNSDLHKEIDRLNRDNEIYSNDLNSLNKKFLKNQNNEISKSTILSSLSFTSSSSSSSSVLIKQKIEMILKLYEGLIEIEKNEKGKILQKCKQNLNFDENSIIMLNHQNLCQKISTLVSQYHDIFMIFEYLCMENTRLNHILENNNKIIQEMKENHEYELNQERMNNERNIQTKVENILKIILKKIAEEHAKTDHQNQERIRYLEEKIAAMNNLIFGDKIV